MGRVGEGVAGAGVVLTPLPFHQLRTHAQRRRVSPRAAVASTGSAGRPQLLSARPGRHVCGSGGGPFCLQGAAIASQGGGGQHAAVSKEAQDEHTR